MSLLLLLLLSPLSPLSLLLWLFSTCARNVLSAGALAEMRRTAVAGLHNISRLVFEALAAVFFPGGGWLS
jgi:hypothetical protein